MNIWKTYTNKIEQNCSGRGEKDVNYWRNNLFAWTIIYLLPFGLIALLPGIYFSFITGKYILAAVDIITATGILFIAFLSRISLVIRKSIFVCIFTLLSCTLLVYLGLSGPGLLYLLATCIFSLLIFPNSSMYWPAWIITFICILFSIFLLLSIISWEKHQTDTVGEWIAVSSNLVFLCFLLTALIPRLFKGLQKTIDNEKQLKKALSEQQLALKRALEQVQQKNQELEQFAFVASHDLQEPLRMVTSFMGLLKSKYGNQLDEKAHTYIHFAVDGGKRMQKMIIDLLELSRTGRSDAIKDIVDLNEIIDEVTQNVSKLANEYNASIIVESKLPALPAFRGDMYRLFQNLITNAIKFSRKDVSPVIRITCSSQNDLWLIKVADNGIGIEEDYYEKIFDIFSRLHQQETYQGSGIGLAVCKKIVEQHGGTIWVRSNEGIGSSFYFTIQKQNL